MPVSIQQDRSVESMAGDIKAAVEAKTGCLWTPFATSLVSCQITVAHVHQASFDVDLAWITCIAIN